MESEAQEQKLSEKEKRIVRIKLQLEQNERFFSAAASNETWRKKLLEQREKLQKELALLEQEG